MGGLFGSIFDLVEGNPEQNEQNQIGALGTEQTGTGEGLVTSAAGYDQSLLSGDPSKIAQTLTPEISTGQGIVQQQELKGANFGNRSGGTNASTQSLQGQERGNIINLAGGLQSGAASAASSLGSSQESSGAGNIGTEAREPAARDARQPERPTVPFYLSSGSRLRRQGAHGRRSGDTP